LVIRGFCIIIKNMANLSEIKKNRQDKLKKIINSRINPYPLKTKRTHKISEVIKDFTKLEKGSKQVIITGRLKNIRGHGGAVFLDVEDGSGKIQVLLRKNNVGEKKYNFFKDIFDIGDFVEVKGDLFKTRTKEKTIQAADFRMLTKTLLPLPEKWHGLQDVEERYRKRYLDLMFNPDIKKNFKIRSQIIKSLRDFLEKEEFLEVETPVLQPIYGGARAKPFKTHLNSLDIDLYLRIATELYLKRLLIGGFDKVYEIGKCFRNEGMDKSHNPEYTHFEFYWAYADYKDLMKMTERMFVYVVKKVFGKLEIEQDGQKINIKAPWKRIEFSDLIKKYTKIDLDEINQQALFKKAKEIGVGIEKGRPKAEIADEIYKKFCRPKILQPTFIIHHPFGFQPLAKALENNPKKLANFQLVIGGIELANAFSELNDPLEQRKRFQEQERFFKLGLEEAQRMDEDFLEALEYGMPPAAGFGMGIDRLVALLTNSNALREIILFPLMRSR